MIDQSNLPMLPLSLMSLHHKENPVSSSSWCFINANVVLSFSFVVACLSAACCLLPAAAGAFITGPPCICSIGRLTSFLIGLISSI